MWMYKIIILKKKPLVTFPILLCLLAFSVFPSHLFASTIFQDSFDTGDFSKWGQKDIGWCCKIEIVPNFFNHTNVAKITYLKNEDRGHLYPPNMKIGYNHLYMRWYEYFADGFDFPLTLKTNLVMGANPATGLNEYEIYIITWGDPLNHSYDKQATNIGFVQLRAVDKATNSEMKPRAGRWYCIEEELVLNTPGQEDGIMRLWINGNLLLNNTSANVRGTSTQQMNRMWFGGNYSNSNAGRNPTPDPARPSYRYMDDFIVTTGERIGCLGEVDIIPPAPPK